MNDPVLLAYTVKQGLSGKNIWTRIGAVFPHEQGAGLTLVLDVMPIGRRIILLEPHYPIDGESGS